MRKYLIDPAAALILAMSSSALAQSKKCCTESKLTDAACCGNSYFDGVSFKSVKLHKALTGKTVKASSIKCDSCKKALKGDGTCDNCKLNFADGKSYASKVAYTLSKGKAVDTSTIECEGCPNAYKNDQGRCESCDLGWVGNKVFKDKKSYKAATEARVILAKAVETSKKCEACAVAMVTDGTCDSCKVSFKDGKKTG